MVPVVRISEESYERLKSWAEPLEDTAEDALRKVLDAAELQRKEKADEKDVAREIPAIYVPAPQVTPDAKEESILDLPDQEPDSTGVVAERMYVSLPDEFKALPEGRGKAKAQIARKAYLERIEVPAVRPRQWVRTPDGLMHYLGYSKQNSPGAWFFGADETLVEKYLENNCLASFVFLCGMSDELIIAVPVSITQLEQWVRLGIFSKSDGQLKFNVRREAGDAFFLGGREIK